jgi:hypothetical protein
VGELIPFPQNPLTPYFGVWCLDPLSVGRRKASTSPLRDPHFALLWKSASIAERHAKLAAHPALAQRYTALCDSRRGHKLDVSAGFLVFQGTDFSAAPRIYQVVKVTVEGRSVIAQVMARGQSVGYEFRRQQSWILVSERYYGRAAALFPRSPVFRYYRELAAEPAAV